MKKITKIALIAIALMVMAGGLFAAVKDVNWYNPKKMSFDIGVGYVGGGFGAAADFDYTLGNWNWGFGPINYRLGGFASVGYNFGSIVASAILGTSVGGLDFVIGPVFSVDWALGSVLPEVGFLNKLSFFVGVGAGFALRTYDTGYFPLCFINIDGVKFHISDGMALVLQESWAWNADTTFGVEFKF